MSELDLGGASDDVLQPPIGTELRLQPPEPVHQVPEERAAGMVPVPAERRSELEATAAEFVDALAAEQPGSPEFTRRVGDIVRMGQQDVERSAQTSSRLLDRPSTSLAATRGRGDTAAPQAQVAKTLQDLRETVSDLDPGKADLTGARKLLGMIPGASHITRYFHRFESSQQQLDAIIGALVSGQDSLRKDNAAIDEERAALWTTMGKLAEYETLARALDGAIEGKAADLRPSDPRAADGLVSDALFPIRQRRQDLLTQIAVSVQGYLALDLVRKNNVELITGVDRARTTTVAALRTAVVVSEALGQQKLVLQQISALNETTDAMIARTGDLLRQQTATVHDQAVSSGVSVATLQKAFDDVLATIDAVDSYRAQAVGAMAETVDALETQVTRAHGALERSHRETEQRDAE